jgi:hypothetical protein
MRAAEVSVNVKQIRCHFKWLDRKKRLTLPDRFEPLIRLFHIIYKLHLTVEKVAVNIRISLYRR